MTADDVTCVVGKGTQRSPRTRPARIALSHVVMGTASAPVHDTGLLAAVRGALAGLSFGDLRYDLSVPAQLLHPQSSLQMFEALVGAPRLSGDISVELAASHLDTSRLDTHLTLRASRFSLHATRADCANYRLGVRVGASLGCCCCCGHVGGAHAGRGWLGPVNSPPPSFSAQAIQPGAGRDALRARPRVLPPGGAGA